MKEGALELKLERVELFLRILPLEGERRRAVVLGLVLIIIADFLGALLLLELNEPCLVMEALTL